MSTCVFCLKHRGDPTPWVADNPGDGCTYGMKHEFPEPEKPKQQAPKRDASLCTKCGLHAKNPASQKNGCEHEYPAKEES
jgi:hypothetical protein